MSTSTMSHSHANPSQVTDIANTIDLTQKNQPLWQAYQEQKSQDRMLFPTEGAKALGVSELELMLASPHSRYIGKDFKSMLQSFASLSAVESIVRNEYAVHEKLGQYNNLKLNKHMGLMINVGGLDLRYFVGKWHHMLAVDDTSNPKKPSHSVQFYDEAGNAINKVYLRDDSEVGKTAWEAAIQQHSQAVDSKRIELIKNENPKPWQLKTLNEADQETLQQKWLAMTDVHQFFGILKTLDIDRASSYTQAPKGMTKQLSTNCADTLLERIRDAQCPIMIFVGNTGVIQIQTGTVKTVKRMGDWINILDKTHNDFTLHLKDRAIAQLWCVKRPTKDGLVTCIEAFDDKGNTIVTIFGQRQEGQAELDAWVNITDSMMNDD